MGLNLVINGIKEINHQRIPLGFLLFLLVYFNIHSNESGRGLNLAWSANLGMVGLTLNQGLVVRFQFLSFFYDKILKKI